MGVVLLSLLALVGCRSGTSDERTAEPARPTTSVTPAPDAITVGRDAWIDVAVATLWAEPDQARPLDAPSLTNPVDIDGWLAAMTVDDRRWLVDRLVTQALYGDRVTVDEIAGDWVRVVVLRQPTSLDPRGYPGWLPSTQLTTVGPAAGARGDAVVNQPSASLQIDDGRKLEVSFNTRLPVIGVTEDQVTVSVPGGRVGRLSTAAVDTGAVPATSEDVARSAQLFTGIDYLWAGTSAAGWDCSGLTSTVYAAHGVVIPRDAHDQAAAGTPVERDDLRPGDLLFFGADSVTHVGMYVGDGRMIQAPATGRQVETVSIDTPGVADRFLAARRYLPQAA